MLLSITNFLLIVVSLNRILPSFTSTISSSDIVLSKTMFSFNVPSNIGESCDKLFKNAIEFAYKQKNNE